MALFDALCDEGCGQCQISRQPAGYNPTAPCDPNTAPANGNKLAEFKYDRCYPTVDPHPYSWFLRTAEEDADHDGDVVPKACVLRDHVVADDAGGVTFVKYPPQSACTLHSSDSADAVVTAWSQRVVDNGECDGEADKSSRYMLVVDDAAGTVSGDVDCGVDDYTCAGAACQILAPLPREGKRTKNRPGSVIRGGINPEQEDASAVLFGECAAGPSMAIIRTRNIGAPLPEPPSLPSPTAFASFASYAAQGWQAVAGTSGGDQPGDTNVELVRIPRCHGQEPLPPPAPALTTTAPPLPPAVPKSKTPSYIAAGECKHGVKLVSHGNLVECARETAGGTASSPTCAPCTCGRTLWCAPSASRAYRVGPVGPAAVHPLVVPFLGGGGFLRFVR